MSRSIRTDILQPTWQNGFARYAGESAHPELWPRGEAWAPGLGPTGDVVHGVVNGANGDLTNMEPGSDWQVQDGRYVLNFDDEDPREEVRIPAASSLEVTSVTISAWVYLRAFHGSGDAEACVFEKTSSSSASNTGYALLIDGKKLIGRFVVGGNVAARDTVDPSDFTLNEWKHVACTYDKVGGDSFLYVGGAEVDTTASVGGAIDTGSDVATIGTLTSVTRFHWDGFIDDMFIYNRPLSASEIFKLYSLKRGGIFERKPIVIGKAVAAPPAGGPPKGSLALLGVGV